MTADQYVRMQEILSQYFGVPDSPAAWILVSGEISSRPRHSIRFKYGEIGNAVARMDANTLAQKDKNRALQELNDQLESAVNRESERIQKETKSNGIQDSQKLPEVGEISS